ncbi:MAG: GNA1162 family protein [Candidatus Anammoxibacter sp.]
MLNLICKTHVVACILILSLTGCGLFRHKTVENQPGGKFFLDQKDAANHGKKGTFDRIYQLDPGGDSFKYDDEFISDPPRTIAILPFENLIGGNIILNGFTFHRKDKKSESDWSWTYANRLRTYLYGHLVPREFDDLELFEIDAVLHKLNIVSPEKLYSCSPQELGYILGADALIYGKVTRYDSSYYGLYSKISVGLAIRCVSTKNAKLLFSAHETRSAVEIRVATNPIDMIIASIQNGISLRDLYRARASEEVCREIILRIPVIESLKKEKEDRVIERVNAAIPDYIEEGPFNPFIIPEPANSINDD